MKRPRGQLFLEREGYRRRRLMDAARLLPVLGALLFMLPVLWAPQESAGSDTVRGLVFVFAVWAGLIAAAWLLARRLAEGGRTGGKGAPSARGNGDTGGGDNGGGGG